MYGTDVSLSNVNETLDISELLGPRDNFVISNIDNSGLQGAALIDPNVTPLLELQAAIEIDASALSAAPLTFDEELVLPAEIAGTNDSLTGLSETDATVSNLDNTDALPYQAGVFTVGESGQISIDFLFDGGKLKNELAIFNLSNMDTYEAGSAEFIQEAARRALSNSTEGYVVIADRDEGARFDGVLNEHENNDWNSGEYLGVKTFAMNPGDQFGFMLTTKGNVQKILGDPDKYLGKKQPLFSMAEANPDGEEQIADITGDLNTFGFEDLQINRGSDRDFNDLIFKVEGVSGGAFYLEDLFDETVDWRNSDVGQELIQFVVDPEDLAGNTIDQARRVQVSSFGKAYRGWVGSIDPADYYSFSLGATNEFTLSLDGLNGDADIELLDSDSNVLIRSSNLGITPESMSTTLDAGAYRFRVLPVGNNSTSYDLKLSVKPLIDGITTTGSETPNYLHTNQSLDLIRLNPSVITPDSFTTDPRFTGINGGGWSTVIIDTGINANHPFFGPDGDGNGIADQIIAQWDFAEDDAIANDPDGHGTHVSSIAASQNGVARNAGIIHLKVFPDQADGNGDRLASTGDIEQALQWVIENAARFNIASVNMSLGAGNFNSLRSDSRGDELQLLADLGIITVASSGNDFAVLQSNQGVGAPSSDPNVLSVGAVFDDNLGANLADINNDGIFDQFVDLDADGSLDQADFNGDGIFEQTVSYFSDGDGDNIFETIANVTAPDLITPFSQRSGSLTDILAPGSRIRGAGLQQNPFNPDGTPNPNFISGFFAAQSGTSQAAPHIAGMAVLAQQLAVQQLGRRLTPEEFRRVLSSSGDVINDGDDEIDNVANTGLNFRRANMLNLGNAIVNLNTVEVEINRVKGDFDPGGLIEGPRRGDSDFYAVVSIGNTDADFDGEGEGEWRTKSIGGDSDLENPGWIFRRGVEDTSVPIRIAILDRDKGIFNDDDRVDINPNPRPAGESGGVAKRKYKDLILNLDLISGAITDSTTGQFYGQRGEEIYLQGDGSDGQPGEFWFTVNGWGINSSITQPITLAVHRVTGDFDSGPFNDSDFYVSGTVADNPFDTQAINGINDLRPEWYFTGETTDNIVPISLSLFDEDIPFGEDTQIDLNPNSNATSLDLRYDQTTGNISDAVTGQVYGARGELVDLQGAGDDNSGRIWFSVYGPA